MDRFSSILSCWNMERRSLSSRTICILACALASLLWLPAATGALAGSEIKVDWTDPELKKYSNKVTPSSRSIQGGAADRSPYKGLKLPVMGLKTSKVSSRGFFSGQATKPPDMLMNKSNPVWYELAYEIEDGVVATVAADLRIQSELPGTTRTYAASRSATADDSDISIFDDRQEVGMIGAVAEFTSYRFGGVPYVVTVECTEKAKARCKNRVYLKSLRERLEILYANAPQ